MLSLAKEQTPPAPILSTAPTHRKQILLLQAQPSQGGVLQAREPFFQTAMISSDPNPIFWFVCSASNTLQSPSVGCGGTAPGVSITPPMLQGPVQGTAERIWEFCTDSTAVFSTAQHSKDQPKPHPCTASASFPADAATASPSPAPFAGIFWF